MKYSLRGNLLIFIIYFLPVQGELYTSTAALSSWASTRKEVLNIFKERIQAYERRLSKIHLAYKILNEALFHDPLISANSHILDSSAVKDWMEHPVYAFVVTNRLVKAVDQVNQIFEDEETTYVKNRDVILEFDRLKEKYSIPTSDDLIGCGEALLRLQAFYNLETDDLIYGKLFTSFNNSSRVYLLKKDVSKIPIMKSNDCFELGKIAYRNDNFKTSLTWFSKAMDLIEESTSKREDIVQILEYMAFAAYNLGSIRYAAQLTRLWLAREPENERALGNLEYYLEELGQKPYDSEKLLGDNEELKLESRHSKTLKESQSIISNIYSVGASFNAANYAVEDDKVLQNLCSKKTESSMTNLCWKNESMGWPFSFPEIRFESLHSDPDIIRVYDILTDQEASHLRQLASSRLERSTVQTKSGLVITDFRIAKTAWISRQVDLIVDRVELRLSRILSLSLESSEDLQVVNYGIGGFYGPHLDSARQTLMGDNASLNISSLSVNDRIATVLIYLNRVEAGGATVFPKLSLSVQPVEKSAVIWFNLLKDGYTDDRTLHTGCPVLLGSKWIATKWPREKANIFLRPCKLKQK